MFDPKLDLVLERIVQAPSEAIWRAWTQPEILMRWFTVAPWKTVDCSIDLRPGGVFRTVFEGPDGQRVENQGCYLAVEEGRKLVWTSALAPGFRPLPASAMAQAPFLMTATITLTQVAQRTRYNAHIMHGDKEARLRHEQMGFYAGWGKALDQLLQVARAA